MAQSLMTNVQQSPTQGSAQWTIFAGEALRLDIGPGARELHVTQGRLWLTRDGRADAPAEDLWLSAGDRLALPSGSEWVIEGWNGAGGDTHFQLLVPPSACPTQAKRLSASVQASSSSSSRRRFSLWPVPALG